MPNAEYYVALTIGELAIGAARVRAEADALKDRIAQLEAQQPKAEPPKDPNQP